MHICKHGQLGMADKRFLIHVFCDLYTGFEPSQLSCALVAQLVKASSGKLMVAGLSPTRGSQFFFEK